MFKLNSKIQQSCIYCILTLSIHSILKNPEELNGWQKNRNSKRLDKPQTFIDKIIWTDKKKLKLFGLIY